MSEAAKPLSAKRERLPDRREHTLISFTTVDGFRYTAGLGYFEDGRLAEIFLNAEKIGTAIETAARDSAVVASLALQHGVPPETIRRALTRNGDGSASGALGKLLDLLTEQEVRARS
jgi:ribonucleoside-diphosphate reductase alpha chain